MSNTCSCLTDVVSINLWTYFTSLAAFHLPIHFWLCKPAHYLCDLDLLSSQQRMPHNESARWGTSLFAAPHRNILAFWNGLKWGSNNWMFDCSPEETETWTWTSSVLSVRCLSSFFHSGFLERASVQRSVQAPQGKEVVGLILTQTVSSRLLSWFGCLFPWKWQFHSLKIAFFGQLPECNLFFFFKESHCEILLLFF